MTKSYLAKLSSSQPLYELQVLSGALNDRQILPLPGVATGHSIDAVTHQPLDVGDISDAEVWRGRRGWRGRGGTRLPHGQRAVEDGLGWKVNDQGGILAEVTWCYALLVYNRGRHRSGIHII